MTKQISDNQYAIGTRLSAQMCRGAILYASQAFVNLPNAETHYL